MKFLTLFLEYAKKFSDLVLRKTGEKIVTRTDKKIGTEKQVKRFIMAIASGFVGAMFILMFMDNSVLMGRGYKDFEKQKGTKFGIAESKEIFQGENVGLQGLDSFVEEASSQTNPFQKEMTCNNLHEKVKSGIKLSSTEFTVFKDCLDSGTITGLSQAQRKALERLADPNSDLTEAERNLLEKLAKGELKEGSDEFKIAQALLSDDPFDREVARKLLDPNLSEEERKALLGYLDGTVPREIAEGLLSDDPAIRAKALEAYRSNDPNVLKELQNMLAEKRLARGENLTEDDFKKIKEMQESIGNEIAEVESEIADLENTIRNLQPLYDNAIAKRNAGIPLTPEEEAIIKAYEDAVQRLAVLRAKKESLYARLNRIKTLVASALDKASYIHLGMDFSSIEEYEPPKAPKITLENKTAVNRISPSEYELIKRIAKARRGNDFDGSLHPNIPMSAYNGQEIKVDAMNSARLSGLKNYELDPTLKIPCETRTEILVTKKDSADRRIVCVFLSHVYNPKTGSILIPKGARAIGRTQDFDSNTELMKVIFDKVTFGSERMDIGFMLVDANGRQGLPGRVMSTRNKKITSAILTEFASGVVQYFSRQAQLNLAQAGASNLNLTTSMVGATYSGLSGGLSEIAKIITQDLQDSPDIYFTPVGHKLHLTPL